MGVEMLQNDLVFESSETNAMNVIKENPQKADGIINTNESLKNAQEGISLNEKKLNEKEIKEMNEAEFKAMYSKIDETKVLNLNDKDLKKLFDEYTTALTTELASIKNKEYQNAILQRSNKQNEIIKITSMDILNAPEELKQKVCLDLLKGAYVDYIIENISANRSNNVHTSYGQGWDYEYTTNQEGVLSSFENTLLLPYDKDTEKGTSAESVYNLARYIKNLEEKNKTEALYKLSSGLLKPVNDMPDVGGVDFWHADGFTFNVGGMSNAIDTEFTSVLPKEKIDFRGGNYDKTTSGKVPYNYILEQGTTDIEYNDNYVKVNSRLSENTKDINFDYELNVSDDLFGYIDQSLFGGKVKINVVSQDNVFDLTKTQEVFGEEKIIQAKVPGLEFNKKPTDKEILNSLMNNPDFADMLNNPEKYILNYLDVTSSASHVPTDYKGSYVSYPYAVNEKKLSEEGSPENQILAKDRGYAYLDYFNRNISLGKDFNGASLNYSVTGGLYDPTEDINKYKEYQYAKMEARVQKKELKKSVVSLKLPEIVVSAPEKVSFVFSIPPRPENSTRIAGK